MLDGNGSFFGSARGRVASRIPALVPLVLLAACSVYDEKLIDLDASSSGSGESDGGGDQGATGSAGAGGGAGTAGTAGVAGTAGNTGAGGTAGGAGADAGDDLLDGGELLEDGCVPEICDGEDNDCDGETDEEAAGDMCDLPNGESACVNGDCALTKCLDLYGDCDGEDANGCETPLDTPDDCGFCDTVCARDNAVADCGGGICGISSCNTGFENCDGDLTNGCERDLNDGPCPAVFPYTPGNFDPAVLDRASAPQVTLDCAAVYDSSDPTSFDQWCGQPAPPVSVSTASDPPVVILTLLSFSVTSAGSLTIVGDKPVILAVFGPAVIDGLIDASASGSTPGPGGNLSCGSAAGENGGGDNSNGGSGGGGGGFGTAGGRGGDQTLNANGGSGGATRGSDTLVPLWGGCPGGRGGGCSTSGGGGGGAIQVSAAGELTVTGN
jgi:hypothetical protein